MTAPDLRAAELHDEKCELYGGFHTCKCWLRARGHHPALNAVREWYFAQHPEDQHCVEDHIDRLEESMHRIDREQEQRERRMRP